MKKRRDMDTETRSGGGGGVSGGLGGQGVSSEMGLKMGLHAAGDIWDYNRSVSLTQSCTHSHGPVQLHARG